MRNVDKRDNVMFKAVYLKPRQDKREAGIAAQRKLKAQSSKIIIGLVLTIVVVVVLGVIL